MANIKITNLPDGSGALGQSLNLVIDDGSQTMKANLAQVAAAGAGFAGGIPEAPKPDIMAAEGLSLFDGTAATEWVLQGANGTLTDDTTNVKRGFKSMVFAITEAGDNDAIRKTLSIDLSTLEHFAIRWYCTDATKAHSFVLYFSNSSFATFFSATVTIGDAYSATGVVRNGWNLSVLSKKDFTADGSPSWASVDALQIRLYAVASETCTVTFDELTAYNNPRTKGLVLFTFDDGYESQYTQARPMLDKYRYPATAFVVKDNVGVSGFMTLEQVQTLQNYSNWDIGNHTASHADLTALTDVEAEAEILENLVYLRENGLKGAYLFAYPQGKATDSLVNIVKKYSSIGRMASYSGSRQVEFPIMNPFNLFVGSVLNTTSLADVEGWVDAADTNNMVLVLVLHKLVATATAESEWTIADFSSLVDYVATKNVDVLSFSQYLKL